MPDADWWEQPPSDALGVAREVPALEAEVRRLRAALLRIADAFDEIRSWESLRAASARAEQVAKEALATSARPGRSPRPPGRR